MTLTIKNISILTIFIALSLFVLTSTADASIVVSGDREFTDEVNECLATYRNTPGIVGDVIKELENSDNEHKVINSTNWDNTVNDNDKAFNGSGTGTVIGVDSAELEELKESFEELKNKDFCTALLHELWHAVDADRGEWSNDTVDGTLEDEIEATLFQNFLHAIRGVDPRTSYGGNDIEEHVVITTGDVDTEDEDGDDKASDEVDTVVIVDMSFDHVSPGSFSEIYVTVTTTPNTEIKAELTGPGVDSTPSQTITSDSEGKAKLTWRIVAFGQYSVSGTAGGTQFSSSIDVK